MNFGAQPAAARRDAESTLVPVNDRVQLHIRHFGEGTRNTTVVVLHDLFADGSLFFRNSDALASRLAHEGFDVWVPDLRGKGRSWPALTRESRPRKTSRLSAGRSRRSASPMTGIARLIPPTRTTSNGLNGYS